MKLVNLQKYTRQDLQEIFNLNPRGSGAEQTQRDVDAANRATSFLEPDEDRLDAATKATGLDRAGIYRRVMKTFPSLRKKGPLVKTGIFVASGIPGGLFKSAVRGASTGIRNIAAKSWAGLMDPLSGQYMRGRNVSAGSRGQTSFRPRTNRPPGTSSMITTPGSTP